MEKGQSKIMRVGIIGSGLQCSRRAAAIRQSPDDELIAIAGINSDSVRKAAAEFRCLGLDEPEELIARSDIDVILICTPPSSHFEYVKFALLRDKHVLIEKPMTRTLDESEELLHLQETSGATVRCGFNHRFHPAIATTRDIVLEGKIGKPLFARAIYGIAGRKNYGDEWRADPAIAAGGQFIEQGSHVIDLFQWILGDFVSAYGAMSYDLYPNQELEDGGMAIFKIKNSIVASMHTTLAQWHNRFNLEIYGTDGFVAVSGLGSSYGTEKLEIGLRGDNAPFSKEVFEYRGGDASWLIEWLEFKKAILGQKNKIATVHDGVYAMRIANSVYESSRTGAEVLIASRP